MKTQLTRVHVTPYLRITLEHLAMFIPVFNRTYISNLLALILCILVLASCGGSDIKSGTNDLLTCSAPNVPNELSTECVPPPPIQCTAPTVPNATNDACVVGADPSLPEPVVFPADDQAVLYYNRSGVGADNSNNDPSYEGYRLHTWNNDTCDAYVDADTDWAAGRIHNGIDPNYGAYWILDLKPGYADAAEPCHSFIIHVGTDDAGKEMGGGDFSGALDQDDAKFTRTNFTLSGEPTVFEFPILSLGPQPVKIEGINAHWIDVATLVWDAPDAVESVKVHYSTAGDLKASLESGLNGTSLDLMSVTLTEAQIALAPHLTSLPAFEGVWSVEEAKAVLKTQAVLGGYNADGALVAATGIQIPLVLDAIYTLGEDDANEASFGPQYAAAGITTSVWAPTAQSVRLLTYNQDKTLAAPFTMTEDPSTGIWAYSGGMDLDRVLYRYEVTVFHPITGNIEVLNVTDPYSVSLSTNSRFSQFVNLSDEDLKPEGWDSHIIPTIENFEDAVIYEGHIRDFSVRDESTSVENRGKYLAFTEQGSAPVEHLRKLVESGLTHFHMLPANDIASVDESPDNTVDLTDTVGDLCQLNSTAEVCSEAGEETRLIDLFEDYDPLSQAGAAQALTSDLRGHDQFNWGYDPFHFNVPEGSYASDAEGVTRIKEMRAMNQALHELGLRVALDVVYNHTNESGVFSKSVLDKVVPGYYHRYEVDSGAIVRETCCDDTEPRNAMMEKLMLDSLVLWTTEYKFDSFRFDIMSQASKQTMLRLRDAITELDEDNYFYGEGWTREDRGYEQANQPNMAGSEIGTYNDRIREAVRQGLIFNPEPSDGALSAQDNLKMSLSGTLSDYVLEDFNGVASKTSSLGGYATDPADIINYVSKHDNETLWDQLNYVLPADLSLTQRVRAQNIAATIPLMAQGIPFFQLGGDFLRSKSMDRNTYDSGDWFSRVDFTMGSNNWNVGLPLAEDNEEKWGEIGLFMNSPERAATMTEIEFASNVFNEILSIRSGSALFRLTTGEDVIDRVGFHNIGKRQTQGLVVMSIDDGLSADMNMPRSDLDPMLDALVVLVNSSYEEQSHTVPTAAGFELHSIQASSVDPDVRGASFVAGEGEGTFTVPALTTAVFVKPQMGAQGEGLSAFATAGAPDVVPFGSTIVFIRGSLNGWSEDDPAVYVGGGVYETTIALAAGDHEFKVASADWSTVDYGSNEVDVELGVEKVMGRSQSNLTMTLAEDATLKFSFDASDVDAPILTVDHEEPFFGTTVFIRGSLNGWSEDNPMDYTIGGKYSTTIDLVAGDYEFKIASADWSTVDYGSGEDTAGVSVGVSKALGVSGANMTITIAEDGPYTFVFDASNLAEPTFAVFDAQMFGDTTVFIRGSLNGWGEDNPLVYADGVYSTEITLDAGNYEFKVASADWATVDLGSAVEDVSVLVDTGKTLGFQGANMTIEIDTAATYAFTLTGPDPSEPIVTVTQVP